MNNPDTYRPHYAPVAGRVVRDDTRQLWAFTAAGLAWAVEPSAFYAGEFVSVPKRHRLHGRPRLPHRVKVAAVVREG